MPKLLPVVRGWGWSGGPSSSLVLNERKVEPIIHISDKPDYHEERNAERLHGIQTVDITYDEKGKIVYVCQRSGRRLSIKV